MENNQYKSFLPAEHDIYINLLNILIFCFVVYILERITIQHQKNIEKPHLIIHVYVLLWYDGKHETILIILTTEKNNSHLDNSLTVVL